MGRLRPLIRERGELSNDDVAAMVSLFDRYYEGGSPGQFSADLANKTHVIELRDGDTLCGFSTLCVYELEHLSRLMRIVFSGDTIIDQAYWGEQSLALAFCRFAGQLKAQAPQRPLYWLLISKGQRTYRYLHLFAHRYHPSHASPESPNLATLAAEVARRRFGDAFDAESGLVRFGDAATRLRPQWLTDRGAHSPSPATAYFHQRNPHHDRGDELVCLCELEPGNLRSFALKAFRQGLGDA